MRYEIETGSEGVTCGDVGALLSDLMDDPELPEAVDGLAAAIRGAGLSTVHLHYLLISNNLTIDTCGAPHPEKIPQEWSYRACTACP